MATSRKRARTSDADANEDVFEDRLEAKLRRQKRDERAGLVLSLDSILTHRDDPEHGREYLVKWRGKSHWHNSWITDQYAMDLSRAMVTRYQKKIEAMHKTYADGPEDDQQQQSQSSPPLSTAAPAAAAAAAAASSVNANGDGATGQQVAAAPSSSDALDETEDMVMEEVNMVESDRADLLDLAARYYTIPQRVLDERQFGRGEREFLVQWIRMPLSQATWETETDMLAHNAEGVIEAYHKSLQNTYVPDGPKPVLELRKRVRWQDREQVDEIPESMRMEAHMPFFPDNVAMHRYQQDGVAWLRWSFHCGRNVILADEMGLGKTVQCAAYLSSLYHMDNLSGPFLVVAPLSCLANWERELITWCPDMPAIIFAGDKESRNVLVKNVLFDSQRKLRWRVILTSYEHAMHLPLPASTMFHSLIVDEAHRLKNVNSKLFAALDKVPSLHRVLLTGTPLQNNLQELLNLLEFLDPEKFRAHANSGLADADLVSAIQADLAAHLLRRTKRDVLTGDMQLPPLIETIVRVDLSPLQRTVYKELLTKSYPTLASANAKTTSDKQIFNIVMQLRKCCDHPFLFEGIEPSDTEVELKHPSPTVQELLAQGLKAEAYALQSLVVGSGKLALLEVLLRTLKARKHRVLLYSQMTHMLDIVEDFCRLSDFAYERIDGDTPHGLRQVRIDRFNAPDSNVFIFLLSTRTGGVGINLPTADTVVLYDSDWNPHMDRQALCRAHRLGQKNTVRVFRLIVRNSVEERMLEIANAKKALEKLVVRKNELGDAIRYGAADLFSKSEENSTEDWLQWNSGYSSLDAERLLEAEGFMETEDEEFPVDNGDEFWARYKVVSYGTKRGQDWDKEREKMESLYGSNAPAGDTLVKSADDEGSVTGTAEETASEVPDVDRILAMQYEQMQYKEWEQFGKGKRTRSQVQQAQPKPEQSAAPASAGVAPVSHPLPSEEPSAAKVVSPPQPVEEDAVPVQDTIDEVSWSVPMRQHFKRTVERFGMPHPEREPDAWVWFLLQLRRRISRKRDDQIAAYAMFVLREMLANKDNAEMEVEDAEESVGSLSERFALLKLIRAKMRAFYSGLLEDEIGEAPDLRNMYDLGLRPYMYFEVRGPGSSELKRAYAAYPQLMQIDYALLLGTMKHGYGMWREILVDRNLGLLPLISVKCLGRVMESSDEWTNKEYASMAAMMRRRMTSIERALVLEAQWVCEPKSAKDTKGAKGELSKDALQESSGQQSTQQAGQGAGLQPAASSASQGRSPSEDLVSMALMNHAREREALRRQFLETAGFVSLNLLPDHLASWNESCRAALNYVQRMKETLLGIIHTSADFADSRTA